MLLKSTQTKSRTLHLKITALNPEPQTPSPKHELVSVIFVRICPVMAKMTWQTHGNQTINPDP